MSGWLVWLIIAAGLTAAETMSGDLVLLMLGGGALGAGVVAGVGVNGVGQALAFLAVSAALLWFIRPIAKKHMVGKAPVLSGSDALVGREAVVLETVNRHGGRVKLAGNVWTARAADAQAAYEPGLTVRVSAIDGATAVVWYGTPPQM